MNDYQKTSRGRGSLRKLPQMMEKLGIRKPMIVGLEPLTGTLLKRNPSLLACPVFSSFHPNPDWADTEKGAEIYRREECDGLVSVGGGSSIDTAKAIKARMSAENEEDVIGNRLTPGSCGAHIAIPGTAGTGSEATQFAVVYVNGSKVSLDNPLLRPDGVILDSELLDSLPVYHKKSCALDALAQGIESFWCAAATEESRVHAFLAILGVLDNIRPYLAGDPHAAEQMLDASYESGRAIAITRTTAPHAMSYALTGIFGIAHGHACMLTLPVIWDRMNQEDAMRPVLNHLSETMRLGNPLMGPRLLKGLMYDLEMPIPELPDEQTLERLADSVNPERLRNHPTPLNREELKRIYRLSFLQPTDTERQTCLDLWRYYGR